MTIKRIVSSSVLAFVAILATGLLYTVKGQRVSQQNSSPTYFESLPKRTRPFFFGPGAPPQAEQCINTTTCYGVGAGIYNKGLYGSFFGYGAGEYNEGTDNSFFGFLSGPINTTGVSNSFFGSEAGSWGQLSSYNSFFGAYAGFRTGFSDNANYNSFFGYQAGKLTLTASGNSFFGAEAGLHTNASWNSFFGYQAGNENVSGGGNSFFGVGAGLHTDASRNSFFGDHAGGNNTTGVENSYFGYLAGTANTLGSNNVYIANVGLDAESSTIRIGGNNQKQTFIAGISGVNVSGSAVMVGSDGKLGVQSSSREVKENIRDMGDASSRLMRLRPVTFFYKPDYEQGARTLQYGLIAEEVAELYPELVQYSATGAPGAVRYHLMNSMLLNELQKQHQKIISQQQQISDQAQQIADLESRLERLETLLMKQTQVTKELKESIKPDPNSKERNQR